MSTQPGPRLTAPREVAFEQALEIAGPQPPGGDLLALLTTFHAEVPDEDMVQRDPSDLLGAALSQRALAAQRTPGQPKVRAFTPTVDTHGWDTGRSVVQIVNDDMPFLVDSVTNAIQAMNIGLHLVVHPLVPVRRDPSGALVEVLPGDQRHVVEDDGDESTMLESWIFLEIDRHSDDDALAAIVERLQQILGDVRSAVEDWPQMLERARSIADDLPDAVPAQLREQAEEAQRLLRWLVDANFTFLAYREYDVVGGERDQLRAVRASGLGLLRSEPAEPYRLTGEALEMALERRVLILTKANSRSTVHRPAYLDYIGVKTFNEDGEVVGERRFLGLFTAGVYTESVFGIPVLDTKASRILEASGYDGAGHSGRELAAIVESFPRDEMFQASVEELTPTLQAVQHLLERRRARVFLRTDTYGRFVTALVFLPRDRYTTQVRLRIQTLLTEVLGAESCDFSTQVNETALARLYFVLRPPKGSHLLAVDHAEVELSVVEATRSWAEDLQEALVKDHGDSEAARIDRAWTGGFSEAYVADVAPRAAVADLSRLEAAIADSAAGLQDQVLRSSLYEPLGAGPDERRFKLYRTESLSLTTVLPYFQNLGLEVVDERPYSFTRADGAQAHIYDFGLRSAALGGLPNARELITDAFTAAWSRRSESDGFDRLVVAAGLTWRQVVIVRAAAKYMRQASMPFSQEYLEDTLLANVDTTRLLIELFEVMFDPDLDLDLPARQERADELSDRVLANLDEVASLDQDRILRSFLALFRATLRTNFFQDNGDGGPKAYVAMKLDPRRLPDLPEPRPAHEIWVYSPQVEGVHLRFGGVARGGLRWSDRREDFRTEILGLVKAQMVKNAVIVPTGAKGGFFAKHLPDPSVDREAWLAEGIACYRTFISSLLDITDDLVSDPDHPEGRKVEPPARVVRHDGDDPYLVVAADKGTASFSDIANEVSQSYGFWLDDAFASGGSVGYDHKEMGITARGAWESVKRHFRELDHDTQTEPFTVVGIGDMSGDVFGNGMLLSEQIRLVAAFDHRHIFLDPAPDPATSYAERRRLFELPRSSWADYDTSLISEGGGVYPRTAKSVPITPQVAERLGLDQTDALTPAELISAILRSPADLLWNGGIGTYVKASTQSHADVGDKANDAIRVDGRDLRVKVVGEGGNLGLTQLGRIEAARHGVRINTDAMDNSAGVDCSDHEVNIKILLGQVVGEGDLTLKQRNQLLAEMTGDVASLVLRDNYEQNVLLGNARSQTHIMLGVHQRFLRQLEQRGQIDRALEFLPSDEEFASRREAGEGLTSPEFSVLVAYAKITLKEAILASGIPDEPWVEPWLRGYFPPVLVERYADRLDAHQLRREIIATLLAGDLVNRGGITFVYRAVEETAAAVDQVVRAYAVARRVFDMASYVRAVESHDTRIPTRLQAELYLGLRRLIDRAVRWLLQNHGGSIDVNREIARFEPVVAPRLGRLEELLDGLDRERMVESVQHYTGQGVDEGLATRMSELLYEFSLLDIAELSDETGAPVDEVAGLYYAVSARYRMDDLLTQVSRLDRENRWQALARGALRDDLYNAWMGLAAAVLRTTGPGTPEERIAEWEGRNSSQLARSADILREVAELEVTDLASISVAMRQIRSLIRSASSGSGEVGPVGSDG